ncbi:hypothetical protein Q5762_00110 [Streptomyces sp. P9(2023)]|uniref:hypothetical protein n=1 Tax=Streptomyces sp. P9(2023) TaxID=3064394 RepID=UPI0028F3E729|nr:hypothetical protein [Streptomyces sp. P9(2023)]MDT9686778.1 hypothetical protein [Streptomyces sp. P9(2023)]
MKGARVGDGRRTGLWRRQDDQRTQAARHRGHLGLLLMVLVTAADTTDRDAACGMLERLRARYRKITPAWADGGCIGCRVDWAREN